MRPKIGSLSTNQHFVCVCVLTSLLSLTFIFCLFLYIFYKRKKHQAACVLIKTPELATISNDANNPVLIITGCQKYRESLVAAILRNLHPSLTVVGFLGDTTASEATFNTAEHLLTLPVCDTYEALPRKIQAAFKWVYETFPLAPGVFKTDDDIYFDAEELSQEITKMLPHPYWGLKVDSCKAGTVSEDRVTTRFTDKTTLATSRLPSYPAATYCYGFGYWVSRHCVPIILQSKEFEVSVLEDVSVGYALNSAGHYPVQSSVNYRELSRDQSE